MVSCILTLLMMHTLGSPESEWLLWLTEFGPCLQPVFSSLQLVSGFLGELDLDPAHNACPWLSRM